MLEQMPTRGFQSSVDPRLHFGLGALDARRLARRDLARPALPDADRRARPIARSRSSSTNASGRYAYPRAPHGAPLFERRDRARSAIDFKHAENAFLDFNREPLMPHLLSTKGPRSPWRT